MRKNNIPCLISVLLFIVCQIAAQPSGTVISEKFLKSRSNSETISTGLSYEFYIEKLDKLTPVELVYNKDVKRYIDQFLDGRKNEIAANLSRAERYFPIIEEILDRYDLPLELKYMAVIESGLNPLAKSKSGAIGLWQFLYNTCTLVDLEVNSYIDERRDPYLATEAACKYLKYLYNTFRDWNLVLASYNGGPGEVRKAIERSGGQTDYWEIRPYLSSQASNYVPAFIAMNYLMNYYSRHDIEYRKSYPAYQDMDTLHVHYAVSFEQISSVLNIPVSLLEELNPIYRQKYIPDLESPCILILPKEKIDDYLKYENKIVSYNLPETNYIDLLARAGNTFSREKIIHVVSRGEYFHKIALNYDCTVENIKAWNNLDSLILYPGQVLEIWVKNDLGQEMAAFE